MWPLRLAMLSLLLSLTGCASLNIGENTGAKLAIQIAVIEYTANDPERAARVQDVVQEISSLLDEDPETTIAGLTNRILQLDAVTGLEPERQLQARLLINAIGEGLVQRIGEGRLDPQSIVAVRTVLGWIQEMSISTATGQRVSWSGDGCGYAYA